MIQGVIAGRYHVLERVGQGGAAEVYRAMDTRLGRVVALKLLRETYAQDATFRARFENEARAAARLSHPNIVDVYDYDSSEGVYFIAMEYVPGENLKELINRRAPLAESEVVRLLTAVLSGLGAAHAAGLVHRDMKPQNVLVGRDGVPKIADFGIAKAMGDAGLTEAGIAFGTPHYLAPEQARGDEVTPRTDLYAVGVMSYEMLSGRLPFEGENPMRVAYAHVFDTPKPLGEIAEGVSAGMVSFVERAMSKDASERYGTAEEMLEALGGVGSGVVPAQAANPANPTLVMPVVHDDREPDSTVPVSARGAIAEEVRPARPYPPGEEERRRSGLWLLLPALLLAFLFGCFLLRDNLFGSLGVAPPDPTTTATTNALVTVTNVPEILTAVITPTVAPTATATPAPPTAVPTEVPTEAPTDVPAPGAPQGFSATSESPTRVVLRWQTSEGNVDRYELQRREEGGQYESLGTLAPDETTYEDPDLGPDSTYEYRLRATGEGGVSGWSVLQISTAPLPTPVPTNTPTPEPTATPEPPPTPTNTPEPTPTPSPTPTNTPEPELEPEPTIAPPPPAPEPDPTRSADEVSMVRLEDTDFSGGFTNRNGRYKGVTAQWVYSQQTDYSEMEAPFEIEGAPLGAGERNQAVLSIQGMDSENAPKTQIRIEINGESIFEGANPLPNDNLNPNQGNWGERRFFFNADLLQEGGNTLTITNLEEQGDVGAPPFFMLDYALVAFFEE